MALQDMLLQSIQSLEFHSNYLPDGVIDNPLVVVTAPGEGEFSKTMRKLQPKLVLRFAGVDQPLVIAPYGEPGPSQWQDIKDNVTIAGIAIGALALYGLWKVIS